MPRILAAAERSGVATMHLLALSSPVGNRDIWVLVVVRRELCVLHQVELTLLAYFLWIPSWCSLFVGGMNLNERAFWSFTTSPFPLITIPEA